MQYHFVEALASEARKRARMNGAELLERRRLEKSLLFRCGITVCPRKPFFRLMNDMKQTLIVDDEADVLRMLRKSLHKEISDVKVFVAASSEEALAILAGHLIDLVIANIDMPGMNGIGLLVEINARYPHAGIIAITAHSASAYQSQDILAGSMKFIEKPFDIKYLTKIVEEFFSNRKRGFQGTISGIDLIDIVQFNGLSRATAALKVTNGNNVGMIFFKDGQVVHAICGQLQGEKAFFAILGFRGGNLKNIKGVEAPVVTISKSLELLLLKATSINDEVIEEREEPFLAYEEQDSEPPPAFLSPLEDEVEETLPARKSPALLFDDARARPAAPSAADAEDNDGLGERAYFAKTSSILSAELRDQRAALSDKARALPAAAIPGLDVGDEEFGEPLFDPDAPAFLSDADAERVPAPPSSKARALPAAVPGLDIGGEESGDSAFTDFDVSVFLSDIDEEKLPAALVDPPFQEPSPAVVSRPPEWRQDPSAGRAAVKLNPVQSARRPSSIGGILAEFTAIDGVRLACLVGRNGFLLASQPEGNNAYTEALGAIAASGLASTESMGEELAGSSLQTGLFQYQDGIIILSPVGEDSFFMLVAGDDVNLGWLRLIMRKNTGRIEKISALS